MLYNKRIDIYYIGFYVKFVLIDGKDVVVFNDRSKIVVLDKCNNKCDSYVIDENNVEEKIYKIFIDVSYFEKKRYGGIVFIIEDLKGNYSLYKEKVEEMGSS